MAHELTYARNRWEFAYAGGEAPWHGLGQRLQDTATSAEVIQAAGLDWLVIPEPVFLWNGQGIPGYVANTRSDTGEVLGVVSNKYRTIQNGEVFVFVDSLVTEGQARYYSAGSLRGGRRVFCTAKLPTSTVVVPHDVVDHYLLAVTGHDGTARFSLRWTPVRVVCANTLRAALRRGTTHEYTVRHIGSIRDQLAEARRALGIAHRYFTEAGELYRKLAAKDLTDMAFQQFLDGFMPVPSADVASSRAAQLDRERTLTIREQVRALFEGGLGTDIPGVRGTAWGALNAGIEWIEHVRPATRDGRFRKGSIETTILGDHAQALRQRAVDAAVALLH